MRQALIIQKAHQGPSTLVENHIVTKGFGLKGALVSLAPQPLWGLVGFSGKSIGLTHGLTWWARWDSNPRPRDYESSALTAELRAPSSGGETRTLNHTVNSRVLCRLSYPGIDLTI